MKTIATATILISTALASAPFCGQYDNQSQPPYTVNNNLWNEDKGTGSQCTTVDNPPSSGGVAWHTTWQWSGNNDMVKSYANSQVDLTKKYVSNVASIPTTVNWSYSNTNINADVSYDLFTAANINNPTYCGDYELMIWLAEYDSISHIQPVGSQIGTTPSIAGQTWELWNGTSQQSAPCPPTQQTYTFVAPIPISSFSGDIQQFFDYLISHYGFPASSQYLIDVQFGTEAFVGGSTTFTVSDYTASVN